jgi:cobalt/nickel transport system ATP-binding protein
MEKILQLENVSYSYYDHIPALDNVSLSMNEGERFAVIGANGSGKTSLLQVMAGLRHPSNGSVFFRGQEVSEQSLRNQSFLTAFREGVGYVFQDSDVQLFCPTVLDELLFGPLQLGIEENEAVDRALQIMKMLNIERLKERPSYMLSGGEKKRVAIASILTMNPQVLLLDEPTNGLDPRTQCFLTELILDLNQAGKTICVSSHDLSFVDEFQPTVAVLSEAHHVEKVGDAEEILRDEELLLKANLIHEHMHYHGKAAHTHRHSHYIYHKH